ncbi:MAG: hypothetical protein JO025_20555 [Verrucomicrobia bacterium]|nr:hypothetical protein [Verrucomicrobiota bacterium]
MADNLWSVYATNGGVIGGFPSVILFLGNGSLLGIPASMILFLLCAVLVGVLVRYWVLPFLSYSSRSFPQVLLCSVSVHTSPKPFGAQL